MEILENICAGVVRICWAIVFIAALIIAFPLFLIAGAFYEGGENI